MKSQSILILISFFLIKSSSYAQISNGNFEEWPISADSFDYYNAEWDTLTEAKPIGWETNYPWASIGFYRSTENTSERFSIILYSWYTYQNSEIYQGGKLIEKPYSLSGRYKFLLEHEFSDSIDVALGFVKVFNKDQEEIGHGAIEMDTTSLYTNFNIDIDYSSNDAVDSFYISFKNSINGCMPFDGDCKYLFLDELQFEYSPTSTLQEDVKPLLIYPNPSNGEIYLSEIVKKYSLYTTSGIPIESGSNINQIQTNLPQGIYIIHIMLKSGNQIFDKIVIN